MPRGLAELSQPLWPGRVTTNNLPGGAGETRLLPAAPKFDRETTTMKIAVASDHRGVEVKKRILQQLADLGHEGVDLGPANSDSVDYPDYAAKVANAITHQEADRGILICGSGIGMSIAANRFAGVRAALCHDEFNAEICRRHNDANVMCLSADLLGEQLVARMVDKWVKTQFEGGRHSKRLDKLEEYASKASKQ